MPEPNLQISTAQERQDIQSAKQSLARGEPEEQVRQTSFNPASLTILPKVMTMRVTSWLKPDSH